MSDMNKEELHRLRDMEEDDFIVKAADDDVTIRGKVCLDEDSSSSSSGSVEDERGTWGGQFEFLLSVIGYTVGLGNIWRFPYLCLRNGGGAFLIPFFLFLMACGGPLYYLEVCLGQFSGKSPIIIWEICPLFKGIGVTMVVVSALYLWYFGMIFAWVIYFLICSFYPTLGWSTCDNWWNTALCVDGSKALISGDLNVTAMNATSLLYNVTASNVTALNVTAANVTASAVGPLRTAATEFWLFNVLRVSEGIEELGPVQWHLAGVLFAGWLLTFLCLAKGVKTVGKVVYVTATAPYILLTVLLVRGMTLDGAFEGLKVYVTPDFERLKHGQVWLEAAVQVFYSLGPAWGGVITMASFNKYHHKCLRDTVIVCFADAFTAFYGGLVVFSVLGFLAKETGTSVTDLAKSGPGLAFIAYPEALSRLPFPQVWAVLFFITLVFIGIDTQFGTFETCSNAVIDLYFDKLHKHKLYVSLSLTILLFLAGLPLTTRGGYYIFLLADWYLASITIFFIVALECIIVAWIYGADRFSKDIESMTGRPASWFTRMSWCFLIPLVLLTMLMMTLVQYGEPSYGKGGYEFPRYAIVIGNVIAFLPCSLLFVIIFIQVYRRRGGLLQRLQSLLRSGRSWVPNDRKQREVYQLNPYVYETSLRRRIAVNVLGLK